MRTSGHAPPLTGWRHERQPSARILHYVHTAHPCRFFNVRKGSRPWRYRTNAHLKLPRVIPSATSTISLVRLYSTLPYELVYISQANSTQWKRHSGMSSPSQRTDPAWLWDGERQAFYYYSQKENCYIYKNGTKILLDGNNYNVTSPVQSNPTGYK